MAGIRIEGNTSGNVAEVDSNNNLKAVLPTAEAQAGFATLAHRLSKSTDAAGAIIEPVRGGLQGRLLVDSPGVLFTEVFNNTTLNSALFTAPVTTQTVTAAAGALNLNASAITTLSTVSRVSTYQHFQFLINLTTYALWDGLLTVAPQANCTIEMGFGIATGLTAPTDGAFFRYDATGTLKAVLNTNGSELTSAAITAPSINVMHEYKVFVENDRAMFYIDGACVASIATPVGSGFPTYAAAQPWFSRVYHAATGPSLANTLKIGNLYVGVQGGHSLGKDNATVAASRGGTGLQGQTGQTMGSTANLTNSMAAGAGAAATNTTAAVGSGLGGQFAVQPTLAQGTDGIISSFLNPVPTAAITGKTLYIKGVRVQGVVTTALTGGPVVYEYSLAFGHNAVSLATAEGATSKAPRRIPIGVETFAVTAAVGVVGSAMGQSMTFNAPIPVMPGEFIQLCAKNLGTVTSAGVILLLVTFDSYWE